MESKETKAKKAFLKEFGHVVSTAIYKKYGTKNKFLTETGIQKQSLHLVTTGGDTRLGTVYRIAKALGLKVKDLMPNE
jgi:DNA-binding phage protein